MKSVFFTSLKGRISAILLTVVTIFITILYNLFFALFISGQSEAPEFMHTLSGIKLFLLVVLAAPLLETLLFQTLVIEAIYSLFPKLDLTFLVVLSVISSASLFSLNHLHDVRYAVFGFGLGLIFSSSYLLAKLKGFNAFLVVCVAHSCNNLFVFLIGEYSSL